MQSTSFGTQKIDDITLKTYGIVVAAFLMTDQINKIWFFEKTFLMINIRLDVIFGMPFLILSGANINFPKREL